MKIELLNINRDDVIQSYFVTGKTDYNFTLNHIVPLLDRIKIERQGQNPKFYSRLESDILNGCILPPVTIAFVGLHIDNISLGDLSDKINKNISDAFIIDGLQRLRSLERVSDIKDADFDLSRPIFVNILLCDSIDNLLYRMITLNIGTPTSY